VVWKPTQDWMLAASGAVFGQAALRVEWKALPLLAILANASLDSSSWRRHGAADAKDQLVLAETRSSLGLRIGPPPLSLGLEAGWAWNRSVAEGEDRDERAANRSRLGDAGFASASLVWSF
jgi:hypothetical protein